MKKIPKILCPKCNRKPEWVENKEIYGSNYGKSYMIYLCRDCDTRVGCHNNTRHPLGTMADEETRDWREKAHAAFDPIWKNGDITQNEAYRRMAKKFGRTIHIAQSDIEQCKEIIDYCNQ